MKELHAVLFDLDGTLLDSAQDFLFILNTMRYEHQMLPMTYAELKPIVSEGAQAMVAKAFNKTLDRTLLVEDFLQRYQQNPIKHSRLYRGVPKLLKQLTTQGIRWGIVTNKPRHFTSPIIAHLRLTNAQCVICPEDVNHSKPAPDALLLASEQLAIHPNHCVYIGDHQRDVTAGHRAGMFTIAALWGYIGPEDNPMLWQANSMANQVSDILPILDDHFRITEYSEE